MSELDDLDVQRAPRWEWALEVIVCPGLIGLCVALLVVAVVS